MRKEVHQWFNDGHKVLVILDAESVRLKVICPGLEAGHPVDGLKCGMGTDEPTGPDHFDPICWVTQMMAELGMEAHCTGIAVGIKEEMTIEWGFYGSEGEEFWFKCAGYPSDYEIRSFREEAFAELFPGETSARASQVAKAIGFQIFKPWPEVDQEIKDQLREDIQTYTEDEERKRNAQKDR